LTPDDPLGCCRSLRGSGRPGGNWVQCTVDTGIYELSRVSE